jgi:hypothetical protein
LIRYTAVQGGPAFYVYSTNYLIDTDHGIIMEVVSSTANRTQEAETNRTMIDRVEDRFGLKPQCLIGDAAYGTAAMLNWIIEQKQIEPTRRCEINPNDSMAPMIDRTSPGMLKLTVTGVRRASCCKAIGASSVQLLSTGTHHVNR